MHAILNNKVEQVLEKSIDTHIKLIEMNEYRSQEDQIINDLLMQTIDNTKNLPKLLPDIEKLIKANEKTNGELFETIIKAVKNGNSIESTLTTFFSNHALVKGIEIGTPLIKYLSDFTGIGMQSVLLPDTRKRVGLGGRRKQTRKKRHNNNNHTRCKRFNKRK
jgi:hypothetical protein